MKRIRAAQFLTDYEIREYMFAHGAELREELLIRCIKNEKVNYNDLVLVNSILKFNPKFFELYYDYYYNGRLPSHSNQKNRTYEKKYFLNDILDTLIHRMFIYSNNIEPLSLKKRKEKNIFHHKRKFYII
jgi:hypothetical protein